MAQQGIVFNIQRFTIHDGPGLRTELFLKGCPLRCDWCSNPESWMPNIQLGVYKTKCISRKKCGMCEDACPEPGALEFYRGKLVGINRDKCTNCLACYDECPSDAIKQWGKAMSVEECMKEILRDVGYYERSGGGVTVSGGEPLLQSDFVAELFQACKEAGIQTCLESTFHVDWSQAEKVLPYTDIVISDLKHMDSDIHQKTVGVPNEIIKDNLRRIAAAGGKVQIRIPVIPQFNDSDDVMRRTAEFVKELGPDAVTVVQLLPYHNLGVSKHLRISDEIVFEATPPSDARMQEIKEIFVNHGIPAMIH